MYIDNTKTKNTGRCVAFIDVALIEVDRYPINPKTLALIDHIRSGGKTPPIKVAKLPNGKYSIRDGRHRLLAHKMLGMAKIEARFSSVPVYSWKSDYVIPPESCTIHIIDLSSGDLSNFHFI